MGRQDRQAVAQPGRSQVIGLDPRDGENPTLGPHGVLVNAHPLDNLRPGAFDKAQVIGVINDTRHIGVFVIDGHGKGMGHGSLQ